MKKIINKFFPIDIEKHRISTFEYEDKQEHFVGSHFDAFFEDMKTEVVTNLPRYLEESLIIESYRNDLIENEPKNSMDWKKGYILSYPNKETNDGIGVICGIAEEDSEIQLISIFPWINKGRVYSFPLEKVYVWDNGFEAQLEVDIGFTTIYFYDIHYTINRRWYMQNITYKFQILGIAYHASCRKDTEIEVDTSDELAKALGLELGAKRKYTLTGMASLLPIDAWDIDDYSFSGLITQVQEIEIELIKEKAWVCSTTVLKSGIDDIEYDIDILITLRVWKESNPPKIGDDIVGNLWLQGKMIDVEF